MVLLEGGTIHDLHIHLATAVSERIADTGRQSEYIPQIDFEPSVCSGLATRYKLFSRAQNVGGT